MKIKKGIALLLSIAMLVVLNPISTNAANSATCATYGFQVDTDLYKNIGLTNYLKQNVYLNGTVIGTSNTVMIFATQRSKVGNENVNVAMYYTVMTPKEFIARDKLARLNVYTGKSELLRVTTILPNSTQSLRSTFPENVAGKTEYTLSASTGASNGGVSVGVGASTSITKNRLEIKNTSDVDIKKYQVTYDYKTALLGTDSTNDYLKTGTTQRGSIYYMTDGNPFAFPVTIHASFGYYYGIFCYGDAAQNNTTWRIAIA